MENEFTAADLQSLQTAEDYERALDWLEGHIEIIAETLNTEDFLATPEANELAFLWQTYAKSLELLICLTVKRSEFANSQDGNNEPSDS